MRVIVPYTGDVRKPVIEALHIAHRDYEMFRMRDDESYWRLLSELWAAGQDFAVVEHDIVVHHTVFDELDACPEPWCAFPYDYVCGVMYGMGCVRFRSAIMRSVPDALEQVAKFSDAKHPSKHWCSIDTYLQANVLASKAKRHHHDRHVQHLGQGVAHRCIDHPSNSPGV